MTLQHLDRRCDYHRGISTLNIPKGFCPDCEAEHHERRRGAEYSDILNAAAALLNAVGNASTEVKQDENIEPVLLALSLYLADEYGWSLDY